MTNTAQLAQYIDHTLLKPDANEADIVKLCEEAKKYEFFSVCVNGVWVAKCKELLQGSNVKIAAVVGFPLGASSSVVKAFEAAKAVEDGASEIDMVLQIGLLKDGKLDEVQQDIAQVVRMVQGKAIVKVIFETGMLTDDEKISACRLSEQAGAHFVKTSTGFGKGGATVEDIRLMRAHVSPHIGVKASGAVRDQETALRMIEAGATRIGASAGIQIVSGTAPSTNGNY
ncbi:deoxyribose-phosphate aldolase [Paenibacillus selenitireducens]|uniref:Deoxyribose-phosphate aldolase n=1 Tax=Paenibacillus selenitireducens TaxID=1324314 RepID=A0A1T2XFD3_9BACL|nr:deoxyribose-phosphate aldolase [Paenibacillus selenitireducens]OPA78396.1 deoxyribose-phosphate aldolase [Paenibacillus selenitireducens]